MTDAPGLPNLLSNSPETLYESKKSLTVSLHKGLVGKFCGSRVDSITLCASASQKPFGDRPRRLLLARALLTRWTKLALPNSNNTKRLEA